MKTTKAKNNTTGASFGNSNDLNSFKSLTDKALNAVSGFIAGEQSRLTSHTKDLYRAIADVVALRYGRFQHPVDYAEFILKRGARGSDTKLMKASTLLKCLYPQACWKEYAAKISQHGQCVAAIETLGIAVEDIAEWLDEAEDVFGTGELLKGFAKARAHYRILTSKGKPAHKKAKPHAPAVTIGLPIDGTMISSLGDVRYFIGRTLDDGSTHFQEILCDPEILTTTIGLMEPMANAA